MSDTTGGSEVGEDRYVDRYSDEYTSGLHHDYNGRYVRYDDYEELEAEIKAKDAVIEKLLELYRPEKRPKDWKRTDMDKPEYHAWCLAVPLYTKACQIAGRTKDV